MALDTTLGEIRSVTELDTEGAPLSVLVIDADERVRESLAGLLAIGRRCIVVACAGGPAEAIDLIETYRPQVVLLDPRLPELDSGRTLVSRIRAQWPTTRVVALGSADALHEAGFAGAVDGYVRKTFRPRELLDAIEAATASRELQPVQQEIETQIQN